MSPEDLRAIISFLKERVSLSEMKSGNQVGINFNAPDLAVMTNAGLNAEGSKEILGAGWWDVMVTDIIETPDFCEPDDSPEQVLEYAKDVVTDYLRKRVEL